jgi:mannose-6-phosphate isomerase-like protein (cupin superfamily)
MMQRKSFLNFCMAAGALALSPFRANAARGRTPKGIFVPSGKDRNGLPFTRQPGDVIFNKVSTSDTDGDLYIFDTTRIKEGGPPLHFHYDQDEWWYVISGEFLIRVGDETYHAKAGDSVFGPRGVPHCFAKIGEGEAKIILLFQPAGKMEAFFKAVNEGKLEKMSNEEKEKFRMDHGFKHVGPPLSIPAKK